MKQFFYVLLLLLSLSGNITAIWFNMGIEYMVLAITANWLAISLLIIYGER